jgi:CRISPR-associated protein Cas2
MLVERFNQYRIMWIFVAFDLPTETKADKKKYQEFKKNLTRDGFIMFQYSIYIRHCSSRENAEVHTKRVNSMIPDVGTVSFFSLTDKQFGDIKIFNGVKRALQPTLFEQLEMF